jgi:hypothetical protein
VSIEGNVKRKRNVMFRKNILLFGVVAVFALCFSAQGMGEDKCASLVNNVLSVVGNGFYGSSNLYNGLSVTKQPDGTYVFHATLTMTGEPTDKLDGTCKDRHIQFTRTRTGVFVQKYDGWLFERTYQQGHGWQEMAGTITSDGLTKWGWYGWIDSPIPK